MKILHVISNIASRYGGPSQAVLGMSKVLVEQGHEVTIFTTNQDGENNKLEVPLNTEIIKDGVKIKYFNVHFPKGYSTSIDLLNALKNEVKNFEIVHIHSIYKFHVAAASFFCRKYNVPYIIRPHGTLDPFIQKKGGFKKNLYAFFIENKNMKMADKIHYTAEEEFVLAKPYVKHSRKMIVPNGINLNDYLVSTNRDSLEKKYPELKNKKVILFFSRLHFKKGLDILIDAYSHLLNTQSNLHLLIVGPDNENYSIEILKWAEEKKIKDKITLAGMLSGKEKIEVLKESDVFVLPSYSENFGISVVEAMICKTPVVISNNINIWREIEEHNAGLVVNCDAIEVSNAIKNVLNNKSLSDELSSNGYKMAVKHYNWDEVGKKLDGEYKKIVYERRVIYEKNNVRN